MDVYVEECIHNLSKANRIHCLGGDCDGDCFDKIKPCTFVIDCFAHRINDFTIWFQCPFCRVGRIRKDGSFSRGFNFKCHRHGAGGDQSNRIVTVHPHCTHTKLLEEVKKQLNGPFEFRVHITDDTERSLAKSSYALRMQFMKCHGRTIL